jgi:enterochelin esterase-like enzyme
LFDIRYPFAFLDTASAISAENFMKLIIRLLLWGLILLLLPIPYVSEALSVCSEHPTLPTLAGDSDTSFYQNRSEIPHGTLTDVTYANYLGTPKTMRIYLPPNYSSSGLHYPVVYMSHGMGGSYTDWTDFCNAHIILDNLLADGKAVPMILVMPGWDGQYFGLNLGKEPAPAGRDDAVTQELINDIIPYIESHYRARPDRLSRAIAGISLGGYATINTGLRRLDVFSEIFGYSPFYSSYAIVNLEQNFKSMLADPNTNDLLGVPLYLAMGDQDSLLQYVQQLDASLTRHSINHYFQSSSGGHDGFNIVRYFHQTAQIMFPACTKGSPESIITMGSSGASKSSTSGDSTKNALAGYAKLIMNSGAAPYGTTVFMFKQNGVTVSEAGVPASPPTTRARVFIDYRSNVLGVPGRSESGTVNINTGIGVVNYGFNTAQITYTLRKINGSIIATGQCSLEAGHHFARFINQLNELASDFVLPPDFQFASLEVSSDQPLSIIALRMTTNQRGEPLFTTIPVADVNQPLANSPIYFPQLADGSGWTTSLILINTSDAEEKGYLDICDNAGLPLVIRSVDGAAASSFRYSIPPGGVFRFQTDGSSEGQKTGWVQLIPDRANNTPVGSGVFGYNPVNVLVTESGIPSVLSTTHARIFVDLTQNHNTGLAIANLGGAAANPAIRAFRTDGVTSASLSPGLLPLAGFGHDAKFADQLFPGLPADFTGVLDISSPTPFAAITVRSLYNERKDFLLTTFPIADVTRSAPSPIVFPHIVDGGGYITQFILLSSQGAAETSLNLYNDSGKQFAVGFKTER